MTLMFAPSLSAVTSSSRPSADRTKASREPSWLTSPSATLSTMRRGAPPRAETSHSVPDGSPLAGGEKNNIELESGDQRGRK